MRKMLLLLPFFLSALKTFADLEAVAFEKLGDFVIFRKH
jgi:hypothetical protein